MMGAGIAYACARAGLDVVLDDVTPEAAERGKEYSGRLLDKAVSQGPHHARRSATRVLARITPTADLADLAGCDAGHRGGLRGPGAQAGGVRRGRSRSSAPDALLASNTSTLPITALAEAVPGPADFIGLHFFSPVDKMPLRRDHRGANGPATPRWPARYDLVRQIDKTPIVVNDCRGFFTCRVFGTYVDEGDRACSARACRPAASSRPALQAGYPVGPLAVTDEVTLTLSADPRAVRGAQGRRRCLPHPGRPVVDRHDRRVRPAGARRRQRLLRLPDDGSPQAALARPGRRHFAPVGAAARCDADMQERMLFAEALESVRCLDEGVLTGAPTRNIGSIFGIGFPAWTGGVLQYVRQYAGGAAGFVARAPELADRYGERFTPPPTWSTGWPPDPPRRPARVTAARGGPLAGVRVVELAELGPAPFVVMLLADLGADVVRVDRPGARSGRRPRRPRPVHRGRRVAVAGPEAPAGVAVVLRLVDRADVLDRGFRPGVAERLGIGPEVPARNPRLVYGRMTGWGQDGPLARHAPGTTSTTSRSPARWSRRPAGEPPARRRSTCSATSAAAACSSPSACWRRCWSASAPAPARSSTPRWSTARRC